MCAMRIAFDPGPRDGVPRIQRLHEDGAAAAAPEPLDAAAVAAIEKADAPRWVFARARSYRKLLAAGVDVGRAHDVELVEGLLVAADGHFGQPHGLAAALARLHGRTPDPDPAAVDDGPPALFDTTDASDELADVVAVHAAQQRALAAAGPGMRLLAAAESAGMLVAEEMTAAGLPWQPD